MARPEPGNLLRVWGPSRVLLAAATSKATLPGCAHTPPLSFLEDGRRRGMWRRGSSSQKGEPLWRRPLSGREGRARLAHVVGGAGPVLALPWQLLQILAVP